MGQHKQHLVMHLVMGGGHHQFKKICIWGLSMVVPFLVLFCIFPSGTSAPYNRIVVSQLQVPPLRSQSHLNTLPPDEIVHRKAEQEPSTSSTDEPDLESKKEKRHGDQKNLKKQNAGIKAEMTSMDSLSSKKAGKQRNKGGYDDPIIKTLIDKELDEQTYNVEDIQPKKSSRKGKIKHDDEELSDTAIEEEIPLLGKGDANQDGEASAAAKSRRGRPRKPAITEEKEISVWGKEIGANEEDPTRPNSRSSKKKGFSKSEDSIASEAEEAVSFLGKEEIEDSIAGADMVSSFSGKEKTEDSVADTEEAAVSFVGKKKTSKSFTESGKMGYGTDRASDLLFLESADKEVWRLQSAEGAKNSFIVENNNIGGGEEDLDDEEDISIQAKVLPFSTKQSGKCRYYEGRWIIESTKPLYKDLVCSLMSTNDQMSCKIESKKTKHLRWRWQPSYCKMEHFKAKTFLKIMERKSLAFVGDKLAKAQMESLLCLLAQVEKPNLVYEDATNKSTSWCFNSSNFTISMIWSPYLVQEIDENGYKKLHLDKLDTTWAVMVPTLDVIILGVGSLFIEPTIYMVHDEVVGCYACKDLNAQNSFTNIKEMSLYSGFRATMRSALMGVGALPGFEGITLFLQPYGFEGNGSYHLVSMKMKDIQEEELYQAYKRGSISNRSKMEVLHTDFIGMSKHDNMQGPKISTCLVPSPLANTWNEFLQHTLTHLLGHKS